MAGFVGNGAGQLVDHLVQVLLVNNLINQADAFSFHRADHFTGQQHFHGVLAGHVPGQSHHWRGTEQPDVHARGCEPRRIRRYRQITAGHQLTARGCGNTRYPGNHRPGQIDDLLHYLAALVEQRQLEFMAIKLLPHFPKVVAGTEHIAMGCKHHNPGFRIGGNNLQLFRQGFQHGHRQAVLLLRLVQRERGNAIFTVLVNQFCGLCSHEDTPFLTVLHQATCKLTLSIADCVYTVEATFVGCSVFGALRLL